MSDINVFYGICFVCGMLGGIMTGSILATFAYIANRKKQKDEDLVHHVKIIQDEKTITIKEYAN